MTTIEFQNFIKGFKPEFGNMNHIRVLEMIDRINKKDKLVKEKLKNQAAITRTLKEIANDEKQIIFLINAK